MLRTALRTLIACLGLVGFDAAAADPAAFKKDEQYKEVREVQKAPDAKRILVEEAFWYGCQHCFHFDPVIEAWKKTKPGDVDFVRLPNSLGHAQGVIHQKAFYTAEVLGVGDKIHRPLFDAIHVDHKPLYTQDALRLFFNQQTGIMPDVFDATFTGFAVDGRVRRADGLMKSYGIASVPTVIVGGKYMTNAALNGNSFDNMIKCIDFLIDQVRRERQK